MVDPRPNLVSDTFSPQIFPRSPSDWVSQTIRQRQLLNPPGDGFVSDSGLKFVVEGQETRFRTVVDHVLDHTFAQSNRQGFHGFFTTRDPILTVEAAWLRRSDDLAPIVQDAIGNTLYRIKFDDYIGALSGQAGEALTEQRTKWVAIVVRSDDDFELVTAFPIPEPS